MKTKEYPTEEFRSFMTSDEISISNELAASITAKVHQDLNPSSQRVFLKMLGLHSLVSLFSLSICSQFGIKVFSLYEAMDAFMRVVGPAYCMAFCGVLYLSLSAVALSFLLKPEEIRVIRRHEFLQITLLAGISLGVFLCLGAEVLLAPALMWLVGSLAGGIATFELGWKVRKHFRKQLIFGS